MALTPYGCGRERGCGGVGWWGRCAGWQAGTAAGTWGHCCTPALAAFGASPRSCSPPGQRRAPGASMHGSEVPAAPSLPSRCPRCHRPRRPGHSQSRESGGRRKESPGRSETTPNFCHCWHPGPASRLLPGGRARRGGHGAARTPPDPRDPLDPWDPPDPQHGAASALLAELPEPPCSPSSSFCLRGGEKQIRAIAASPRTELQS